MSRGPQRAFYGGWVVIPERRMTAAAHAVGVLMGQRRNPAMEEGQALGELVLREWARRREMWAPGGSQWVSVEAMHAAMFGLWESITTGQLRDTVTPNPNWGHL